MTTNLLPCPFCGSENLGLPGSSGANVTCLDCRALGPMDWGNRGSKWNTRPAEEAERRAWADRPLPTGSLTMGDGSVLLPPEPDDEHEGDIGPGSREAGADR